MHYISFFLFYLLAVPAIALASSFVLRLERNKSDSNLADAGFLIVFFFLIYVTGIVLGTLGFLTIPAVLALSSIIIITLFRSERQRTLQRLSAIIKDLQRALTENPPLLFSICITVFFYLATPIQEGDSLSYHLPNVGDMVANASTATFDKDQFNPAVFTNYYQKGMEVIYAFCYLFPFPRLSIFLLKLALFSSMYFIIKSACRSRVTAANIIALLLSCGVVANDIASLKNDLPLALMIVYSAVLLRRRRQGHLPYVTLTAALALSLALKANALFYLACLCPFWIVHERRHLWRFALCFAIVVLSGGYFFIENFVHSGTPLYPFGVELFHHTIFPGQANAFKETTILANLDGRVFLVFMRGLLCALGPAGSALCVGAVTIGIWYHTTRFLQGRRPLDHALDLLLLVLFFLGYIITPLSDRNGPDPHNLLLSGNTIRLGLPLFFWAMVIFSRIAAVRVRKIKRMAFFVTAGLCLAIYLNMFWTSLFFLVMKPPTAFGMLAPLALSFDNPTLGIIFIIAGISLGFLSIARWKFALPAVILVSAILYQLHYPGSLSYSSRFKPMGVRTTVFTFLDNLDLEKRSIAVHSSMAYSPFICGMNDYLLRPGHRAKYIENCDQIGSSDLVIVCAIDTIIGTSFLSGRTYRPSTAFFDTQAMPGGYERIFGDDAYIVYRRRA